MTQRRKLLKKIVCPHCWGEFKPSEVLWVSASPELMGDFRLGEMALSRFLPSRFDGSGKAVDRSGFSCKNLACPHCHLTIPISHLEMKPFFVSVAGAPASGKSYFLASMTWQLRKQFPQLFATNFIDADPQMNLRLHEYETQFFDEHDNKIHKIAKTQEQGDLYNTVRIGHETITYPQPFLFSVSPLPAHPNVGLASKVSASLCLYDNAGESYLPTVDADQAVLPVTRHLGKSHCLFFLFDPTQDSRFRSHCLAQSADLQLNRSSIRQEIVLAEVIKRTRSHLNLSTHEQYPHPVLLLVTKLDAWKPLLGDVDFSNPWKTIPGTEVQQVDYHAINRISGITKALLQRETPEMIGILEQFSSNVTFIPVSATGCSPEIDPVTGESGFRPKNIKPIWTTVPLIYALAQATYGLISINKRDE